MSSPTSKAMDVTTVLSILDDVTLKQGKEAQLASMTARCIRAEGKTGILTDPAVLDVINSVRLQVDCGYDRMPKTDSGLVLFVDGSCTRNGQIGAKAGFGVYIVKDGIEVLRFKQRLDTEEAQTNQRGELRGLAYALNYLAESDQKGTIYTDSKYAIDCLKVWAGNWVLNEWKKADKKPVLHTDILKPMYELWLHLTLCGKVELHHVQAHTNRSDFISRGNAVADELANAAAS